jgi:hypothetical protein
MVGGQVGCPSAGTRATTPGEGRRCFGNVTEGPFA